MAIHDGHRQRMYEKAEKGVLAEHEWLEVLLFNAIPRRNTNDIAHALIAQFGSVAKVFFASSEELQKVPGVGTSVAAQIRAIGHFFTQYCESREPTYEIPFETNEFISFVKATYKDLAVEVLDVYLLDGAGYVEQRRRFSAQSIASVQVVPEGITSFILSEGASGVVLVHNHPFGSAIPSDSDNLLTKNCQVLCSLNNRLLCDHLIYAPDGVYSYYLGGDLPRMSRKYSIDGILR